MLVPSFYYYVKVTCSCIVGAAAKSIKPIKVEILRTFQCRPAVRVCSFGLAIGGILILPADSILVGKRSIRRLGWSYHLVFTSTRAVVVGYSPIRRGSTRFWKKGVGLWHRTAETYVDPKEADDFLDNKHVRSYRVNYSTFTFLLNKTRVALTYQATSYYDPVSLDKRLAVTLHSMAHSLTCEQLVEK